jgi:hypothetical protein
MRCVSTVADTAHVGSAISTNAQCMNGPLKSGIHIQSPNAQAEALSSDSEEESEGAELRAAATAYKATAKRCVLLHTSDANVAANCRGETVDRCSW